MLYMDIVTWEPDKRDQVIKRRMELGNKVPEGSKVIGEWVDLHGGRAFRLIESANVTPKMLIEAIHPWSDLCKIEAVPVVQTEEGLKLIQNR